MVESKAKIINAIRDAFQGVELGNGVGLIQGKGLDDYADAETLAAYRAKDEKDDWSNISVDYLNLYAASLSFFDAEGMRFHLPAFLIAHLEGWLTQEVVFHLAYPEGQERFALLSPSQCKAVREVLLLELSRANEMTQPMIETALAKYWLVGED